MSWINTDLLPGIGLYGLIYVTFRKRIDRFASGRFNHLTWRFVCFYGLFTCLQWLVRFTPVVGQMEIKYWTPVCISIVRTLLLTQLYWIRWVRQSAIMRLVLVVLQVIHPELYIMLVVSIHRDFLPSFWSMHGILGKELCHVATSFSLFMALLFIVYLLDRIKRKDESDSQLPENQKPGTP